MWRRQDAGSARPREFLQAGFEVFEGGDPAAHDAEVLGLIVAAPLVVTVMVAVKMLYVEDALGDRLDVPGADRGP